MKVYVSSTFVDLKDYRAAAIRILRQLGHEVVAMEDYVADSAIPLERVLEDVQSCEVYVGIFAWRYGYIPGKPSDTSPEPSAPDGLVLPGDGDYRTVSITEWEYLQATEDPKRAILSFLLEEGIPWPPHLIDGFEPKTSKDSIRALRQKLQRERLVAYFKSPEDLEARVSAAITTVNMSAQVAVNLLDPAESTPQDLQIVSHGEDVRDSNKDNFVGAVVASQAQHLVRIDIGTTWWSTRLYLLAYLVERLTEVRRILVLDNNKFVGLLSTRAIRSHLVNIHPELLKFERRVGQRQRSGIDIRQEVEEILKVWGATFPHSVEDSCQKTVTAPNLRWWFGDAMLGQALSITDLGTATPFDLARLLDFPSDYVPVLTAPTPETGARKQDPTVNVVKVVDKTVLNSELARNYLKDLLNRAGIHSS